MPTAFCWQTLLAKTHQLMAAWRESKALLAGSGTSPSGGCPVGLGASSAAADAGAKAPVPGRKPAVIAPGSFLDLLMGEGVKEAGLDLSDNMIAAQAAAFIVVSARRSR